jgi:hypothetical protein
MRLYLTDRSQFVEIHHMDQNTLKIKTVTSTVKEIKYGVPQGLVLGHLLFLMFINDLPRVIQNAEVVLFADDTSILITENNTLLLQLKKKTTWPESTSELYQPSNRRLSAK